MKFFTAVPHEISMTAAPIAKLPKERHSELLHDLNYLTIGEIKSFCKRHSIPYAIAIEMSDGARKKTRDDDRKGVMLNRLRHFLRTGLVLEATCVPARAVSPDPLPKNLTPEVKLFYGQYDKTNLRLINLLRDLTGGQFRNGAIARILARDFWTRGEAPTFREFAAAWLRATKEHTKPNPEWAFLSDRANRLAVSNWKKLRAGKASRAMRLIERLAARS